MRTRSGYWVLALAAILLAVGSGSQVELHAAGRAVAEHPAAAEQCTEPADPVELTSIEQVRSLAVGTWIRCAGPALPDAIVDGVGLEVADDDQWLSGRANEPRDDGPFYRVYELPDGSLARSTGPRQEGTWGVLDTTDMNGPGSYQLNWWLSGGGFIGGLATFFESPSTMRFDVGDYVAYYHRWTGDPPRQDQPPITVYTSECGVLTDLITPTSAEQATELLVGSWTLCDGIPPFGPLGLDGEMGLEFTADGRYYRWIRQPDGTITRATGTGMEGTWTTMTNSGNGAIQIEIAIAGLGTDSILPTFFGSPHGVRFSGTGTSADYLRVSIPTTTTMPKTGVDVNAMLLGWAALLMVSGAAARASSHRNGLLRSAGSDTV